MTDKYSLAKCEQYGRRLAARLCDQHFGPTADTTLDGPAVLNFTPIRQVNLLVVRQLLHQWQTEINRLRSPYFDFAALAVQVALTQFQNTLSRHIQLARSVFEPLLAQAIAAALHLVIDPAEAFDQLFLAQQAGQNATELRNSLRYLDLNKELFASFINTLPPNTPLPPDAIINQLRPYLEAHYRPHQPMQHLVTTLSTLLPLTEADLWQDGPASPKPVASFVESVKNLPPTPPTANQPDADATQSATELPKIENRYASTPAPEGAAPLYEKLKATQVFTAPLAATLRAVQQPPATSLAERGAPKVTTLQEAISINQRFSFINELFNGENVDYHAAIQHLDSLADYEQTRLYVIQNLAQRYDWSRKEEHMAKLLKLIERKFAPTAS